MTWQDLLYGAPGLLAAIVFHEYAHAWMAVKLGDPTPKYHGRLTLHPAAHIDWLGLIMLFIFRFGWARPVEVNSWNLRNPKTDMVWVAVAGPIANFIVAFVAAVLIFLLGSLAIVGEVMQRAVIYNVFLGVFNLIPVPPLDGSKILRNLLPYPQNTFFDRIEPYGWMILILLIATGLISSFLAPLAFTVMRWLMTLAQWIAL